MKKVISLILSVLMFSLIFTGCDKNAIENEPTQNNAETQESSGMLSDFSTTDIDGNMVDESVLKGKKLTMVNVWTTFCGYCIQEMPGISELDEEYADKGFQVIGIVKDVYDYHGNIDAGQIELVNEIIDETGADYLHILPSYGLNQAFLADVTSYPETFFVDENGNQVGQSYLGARSKEQWQIIIDGLLESMQ